MVAVSMPIHEISCLPDCTSWRRWRRVRLELPAGLWWAMLFIKVAFSCWLSCPWNRKTIS